MRYQSSIDSRPIFGLGLAGVRHLLSELLSAREWRLSSLLSPFMRSPPRCDRALTSLLSDHDHRMEDHDIVPATRLRLDSHGESRPCRYDPMLALVPHGRHAIHRRLHLSRDHLDGREALERKALELLPRPYDPLVDLDLEGRASGEREI